MEEKQNKCKPVIPLRFAKKKLSKKSFTLVLLENKHNAALDNQPANCGSVWTSVWYHQA